MPASGKHQYPSVGRKSNLAYIIHIFQTGGIKRLLRLLERQHRLAHHLGGNRPAARFRLRDGVGGLGQADGAGAVFGEGQAGIGGEAAGEILAGVVQRFRRLQQRPHRQDGQERQHRDHGGTQHPAAELLAVVALGHEIQLLAVEPVVIRIFAALDLHQLGQAGIVVPEGALAVIAQLLLIA